MSKRVLLTEKREEVLSGDYEGSDEALRNQKHRLRESSQTALEELIQVAASPEIENADVFDPDDVARLIDALMAPSGVAVTPRWNFEGDWEEYRETYPYQHALQHRLHHTIDGWRELITDPYGPDGPDGLISDRE